jgi:hypothetical protein
MYIRQKCEKKTTKEKKNEKETIMLMFSLLITGQVSCQQQICELRCYSWSLKAYPQREENKFLLTEKKENEQFFNRYFAYIVKYYVLLRSRHRLSLCDELPTLIKAIELEKCCS